MALIIATLFIILAFIPVKPTQPDDPNDTLNIVTTFFPLYDFTRNIVGDVPNIKIDILFTQTPEVSSFKSSDIQKINNADVLIINGLGLEPILDELIEASPNDDLVIVNTSKSIPLIENDPHVWLNPEFALKQIEWIQFSLMKIDWTNAEEYQKNADSYKRKVLNLDTEIEISILAFKNKDIITFHSAFTYFADRYGINIVETFEESPGKEPSPSDLADIINTVKKLGITALFAEPQFSPKVVSTIANDLGIEVRMLNPIETGNIQSDTYIDLMRENLRELQSVLQ